MSTPKSKTVVYELTEVNVLQWEMVGVVKGNQQFQFEVECPHKIHLGSFIGTTRVGDGFVMAIKAHPDTLYDVTLRVTPSGVCTMLEGRSFKRD